MSPAMQRKKNDLGAGLKVSKQNVQDHPAGPPRYGELSTAERAFTLASTFLSGVLAISASQFMGAPLKLIDPVFYEGYMAYTKECFAVLITCLTQWWAPTVVRVSGDSSMLGQLIRRKDGSLQCNFSDRMLLMANHQLYTDWLYLWWIAYTNNMHGFVYIILKESLKNIPIIGWGAQFYNFIFLARNWEEDQKRFKTHLAQLNKPNDPMWLVIFPEGTNLSAVTREKSQKWAKKNGLQDMKHQLLPRSTGLRFCLQELKETTEWLYDCTIAYEGVPPGQFGQDIFTLRSSYFEGRPPKSVNMHWRRFHIDSIPIGNAKAFEVWLRNRWREKDYMLEYFQRHTRFPAEEFWKDHLDMGDRSSQSQSIRSVPRPAITIETEVKSGSWNEFVKIFAPITSVMMALSVAYGVSPKDIPIPGGTEFFENHMKALLGNGEMKGLPSPDDLEKMIMGAANLGAKQAAGPHEQSQVQQLTQENLAKLVKETAMQNGIGLPRGVPRSVPTKAPGASPTIRNNPKPKAKTLQNAPTRAVKKPGNVKTAAKLGQAKVSSPLTIGARSNTAVKKIPQKPVQSTETQEVTTKSGVKIKIPKTQLEEAKKTGTTVVTANGLSIRVGKKEIEEAQKSKGATIMTSSGVPLKITPSGAATIEAPKTTNPANGPKYVFKPSVSNQPHTNKARSPAIASGTGEKTTPAPSGTASTAQKGSSATRKPAPLAPNKPSAPRKLGT
ncbi:unnamed protein product [Periconia digitata]|uniref:Phospholipid/glycerol acyltransferase domain-containing protein n=1 Tax=Periconia digitata TaxID=1303443 RepID=A0A9W4UI01_9PLEO|nr:unnamed protein product [Periconia digitata]